MLTETFIAAKEESLVTEDRAAERCAKIIAFQHILLCGRTVGVVTSVQIVIPEVVEHLAMELVRAGPGADVHNRAGTPAILSRVGRVIDLELGSSVDRRLKRNLILRNVVEVDTVDLEVDRVLTIARSDKRVGTKTAAGSRQRARRRSRHAAGSQHRQVKKVTAIQRKLLHRTLVDDRSNSDRVCDDDAGRAIDLNCLSLCVDRKLDIDRDLLVDVQLNLRHGIQTKARRLDHNLVVARLQRRDKIDAGEVRNDVAL